MEPRGVIVVQRGVVVIKQKLTVVFEYIGLTFECAALVKPVENASLIEVQIVGEAKGGLFQLGRRLASSVGA